MSQLYLGLVAAVCGSLSIGCETDSLTQPPTIGERGQPLHFAESNGLVSMEAENHDSNLAQGAHSWVEQSDSGASGAVMFASPNSEQLNNTGYTTMSPRLDFAVDFQSPGTYHVWVRGRDSGAAVGSSDSVHVGLNGQASSSSDRISSFSATLGWSRSTMDGVDATVSVPSAGVHTVNVWMREDGFVFDKLVLSMDSSYVPSGLGPAETLDTGPTCGDGTCDLGEACDSCSVDCGACPTCSDSVQNGDETGIDCGGSCTPCPDSGLSAVWIEAESASLSGSPGFALSNDPQAAGGQYFASPAGSSYDTPGSARASYTVNVDAGSYKLWGRVITPNGDDDSFWVSVDGGSFIKWNAIPATTTWAWDDVHDSDSGSTVVNYDLSAGSHTITVANREDGALFDKLYLTSLGDTPSGLGGTNGSCTDGIQNQGETDVDCGGPCAACPVCTDGSTQLGSTSCGLNGRGVVEQLCVAGQWSDTGTCVDSDECADDDTQAGTTSCGLNGRGLLDELCTTGQWQESNVCDDPDQCVDGSMQAGTTPCGNGGTLDQACVIGIWQDTSFCNEPFVCLDGTTQPGTTACGLNGRGVLDQLCVDNVWTDTGACLDPDICVDGSSRAGTTSCGLNGRGFFDEICSFGAWQDSAFCVDPDECVDGGVQDGTTACGNGGTLQQLCSTGSWLDSSTCIEPDQCTDGVQNGGEEGVDCGGSCPPCALSAIWLEAEDGLRSGSPGFDLLSDSAAAGGQYLASPSGTSYDAPGSARVTFTFDVAAGTYALWARLITPGADSDSYWVSVDGGAFVKWNSIPASTSWAWDDVHDSDAGSAPMSYALSAGAHTISIANREDGAFFDKLYFTSLGDVPTGTGPSVPNCSDGVQNQGETGVDCGGPCSPCPFCGDSACDESETCSSCESDCGECPLWSSLDVGAVAATGSSFIVGDQMTIYGSGADINSTYGIVDEFHFVYQPIIGDVTLVARAASVENTNEWAKGGVMIRETLDEGSPYAFVARRPDGGVQAQFRTQVGVEGTDSGNAVGTAGAKYLMVERLGDELSTYYSEDGLNYTMVGAPTIIPMSNTAYVGLAVTSHEDGVLCQAEFEEISLTSPAVCGDQSCDGFETCLSCPGDCGVCPEIGLDARPANPNCLAPPALASGVSFDNVYPGVSFNIPIQALQPPGDSSRLIVVERDGRARSAPFGATSIGQVSTFLQLNNVVTQSNGGLLSMAFHPDWETNHYAYAAYTTDNLIKRVSRFESTDGGQTLNPATEQVVIESQHQHEFNHNGGQLAFGKDGYLYWSTGDDAYLDYQRARHTAQTDNLFGKVIRIDVDSASPYAIPSDNPFAVSGGLPEVWAYGFRNPWRFSFDRLTGDLWLADVGENTWEEVNVVQGGLFYGWPYHEGDDCFTGQPADCATPYASPEYAYTGGAASISGGFVYRGATLGGLYGKYVYGDYVSSEVSVYDPNTQITTPIPGSTAGGAIVGFGEDNDGELYVVRIAGTVQKIVLDSSSGPSEFPALLSQTGCFDAADPTRVVSGVLPYSVAQPFWSDGVDKERYLAIPDGARISVDSDGDFELPPGGVTIKNFRLQGQLFETRFFVRHDDGSYSGYTYEWNDQQTEAYLVPPSGTQRSLPGLEWSYPSRGQCFACHTEAAGGSLGIETRQLNIDSFYPSTGRTSNQMSTLEAIGMLQGNTIPLSPFPAIDDASASLDERAGAYLHVNCSNCHQPGGPGGGLMDVRFSTSWSGKNLCNEPATLGDLGLTDPRLVTPGDHMESIAWLRMSSRGEAYSMPPLASTVVDAAGAALLQEWIDGLTACP